MTILWTDGGISREVGKVPLQGRHVSSGVELGKPTHFTVNAKAAGKGKLDVQFSGLAKGDAVRDVDIVDHHDNTYTVKYTPVQQVVTLAPHSCVPPLLPPSPSASSSGGPLQGASYPLLFPIWDTVGMEGWGWGQENQCLSDRHARCLRREAAGQGDQGHDS